MTQGIYCITNTMTDSKYYGSSVNIESRLLTHQKELIANKHHNLFLQRSVNKYGIEQFRFEIVLETSFESRSELLLLEQTYIDNNIGGFNMAPANGGDLLSNHPHKNEIISKRSATIIENNSKLTEAERKIKYGHPGDKNGMFGRTHTDKVKAQISALNKGNSHALGIKRSDDFKKAVSDRMKGKMVGELNPFYGKSHSEETKTKLSKFQKENCWIRGKTPEEISYTKRYELTYPDGSTIIVYGLKHLASYFKCSVSNVNLTIDRMSNGVIPSKRSAFYNHFIKKID